MVAARRVAWSLAAILVFASACSAGTSPGPSVSAEPSISPSPNAPSATPYAIEDGEPWIVYEQAYTDAAGVEGTGVLLVLPDGPEPHQLLTVRAEHPDWSPDGQRIAVAAGLANGVSEIRSVNADGTDAKTLVACVDAPCTALAAPAWSPDGKQLAFMRYLQPAAMGYEDDQIALEVLDLATGTSRVVAMSPTVADGKYIEYVLPRWSPDGTQIVFALHWYPTPPTDENILGSSIAVVRADGSEADAPRILTPPSLFGAYPDWSPDGQHIVFNTYPIGSFQDTTKAQNLYTIRPDGTEMTQVTHFGENDTRAAEPTWTPDGTRIIFMYIARDPSNPSGARSIAFVDADGSNLDVLPIFGSHPRLRPTP